MGRGRKSKTSKRDKYASFGDMADEADEDADLPKDEAGRRKIKRQYGELLGIRIEKLRGRILNRERINKTIEGIYFICGACTKLQAAARTAAAAASTAAESSHRAPRKRAAAR